ncbi:MAG TPA: carboxypeptidase-like regulatory domain-containing protein, partial [Chitinophaga sp.]
MKKTRSLSTFLLGVLILLNTYGAYAQNRRISGTVSDETGTGLIGATVVVKGGKNGISTGAGGTFTITVPGSTSSLLISYVGFESQEVNVGTGNEFNIRLQPQKTLLNAVVVVGYGTQKRTDLTGAVASARGEDIKSLPVTNVQEALQGRMAGVEVVKSSGAPDATASIIIRGVSSLNNAPPLYIVDGVRQSGDNIN